MKDVNRFGFGEDVCGVMEWISADKEAQDELDEAVWEARTQVKNMIEDVVNFPHIDLQAAKEAFASDLASKIRGIVWESINRADNNRQFIDDPFQNMIFNFAFAYLANWKNDDDWDSLAIYAYFSYEIDLEFLALIKKNRHE